MIDINYFIFVSRVASPVYGIWIVRRYNIIQLSKNWRNDNEKKGSSRKVRETNREEPNEHKEETVISVAISKALGNFNLVIESLKFTC